MFKPCRTSAVETGSISSSGVWKCWAKWRFNRCKFNDDALLHPLIWFLSCQPETCDVWGNKWDLVYLVQLKSKLWLFDVKDELVFWQVYLQGAFVWHRAVYRPQSSHNIRLKRKRIEGQTRHAERAAFSSELAGLSFVYLVQDTPQCSKYKGWTAFIHNYVFQGHDFCAYMLLDLLQIRSQTQSTRSPVTFACKNSLLNEFLNFWF